MYDQMELVRCVRLLDRRGFNFQQAKRCQAYATKADFKNGGMRNICPVGRDDSQGMAELKPGNLIHACISRIKLSLNFVEKNFPPWHWVWG